MTESTALTVDGLSLLMVWTAIGVYALAFAAYAIDLAVRVARVEVPAAELVSVGTPAPPVAAPTAAVQLQVPPRDRERLVWARIGTALTILGFVLQLSGDVLRGIAAARVPWANMYEFALTGTLLIVGVFLFALRRYDLRFLGSFLLGMVVLLLGGATLAFYVEVTPLMDPLRSVWLVIHVFVASLATALFAIACGLSVTQLLQHRRENRPSVTTRRGLLRTLPTSENLEALAYRFAIIGFIFWTFTLIAGAIWANDSWGRFWGFDTKEVWTFIIWVLYAGYIHARATRGWRGNRSAWLSIVGFAAVLFNFTAVNMFFKGLHAYSGLN